MFRGGSLWKPPPVNLYTFGMPDELLEEAEKEEADEDSRKK